MRHLLFIFVFLPVFGRSQVINRFAGNGTAGFSGDGGPAVAAQLNHPTDVFKDAAGNIYVADRANNRIRMVNTSGIITTIAGNGAAGYAGDGGPAVSATLNYPRRVVVDKANNIFIADQNNNVIRKIDASGIISTVAGTGAAGFSGDGGPAGSAEINGPTAVAVDLSGNMYIADSGNFRIRKVNTLGIISTYAGGGTSGYDTDGVQATSISLCTLRYLSVDNAGAVYFTNQMCWHFLKITTAGLVYNAAGKTSPSYSGDGGPADSADIEGPFGICPDNIGNIYLCPTGNHRVRRANALNYITTIAGNGVPGYSGDGGPAIQAQVSMGIFGIYADATGLVYFADQGNNVIRYFSVPSYTDTICTGANITLVARTPGGKWSTNNKTVASVDSISGIVRGNEPGTATILNTVDTFPEIFLVTVAPPPSVTAEISQVTCNGEKNGSIAASVNGGFGHYQYTWSNAGTSSTVDSLIPGRYTLTVKDSTTKCAVSDSFEITQPDSLLIVSQVNSDTCRTRNGSITVTLSGGTKPYQYLWSNSATGNSITGLPGGAYTLVVTDLNNCKKSFSFSVADTCNDVVVHDVVTPNGDGINDVWVIEGITDYPGNNVQLFDKWGSLVYEKKGYKNDWGGKGSNGALLPDGTYFYVVKLNGVYTQRGKDIFTGQILIKR